MNEQTPDTKPPTPRIHRKRDEDRLTLWTDPHGYVKGSFGLGIVGPAIIGIGGVIPWRVTQAGGTLEPLVLGWCGFLVVAGLVLIVLALEMGSTHHRLIWDVGKKLLTVSRRSKFRNKQWDLPRAELTGLSMVEADFTSQNKPVYCLQIERKAGPPIKTMTARPSSEIKWAVNVLGQALDADD